MKKINPLKIIKKDQKVDLKDARITNKTIEHHRQQVLSQARKFKYPLQYEKHKLVINATIVAIIFLTIFSGAVYWQLYKNNDTSNFLFKLTQIVPLPVAKIDDVTVSYNDYLAYYRSSIHYYKNKQLKPTDDDDLEQIELEYKEKSLENALKVAYAKKLAKKLGVRVSTKEIEQELEDKRQYLGGSLSGKAFGNVIKDYYGLDKAEYKKIFIEYPILLKKVSLQVDQQALAVTKLVDQKIKAKIKFEDIASQLKGKVDLVDSGEIKTYNNDGGITKAALKLSVGQVSQPVIARSLSGYYVIKLISHKDNDLRYQAIRIPLNQFNQQFEQLISKKQYKTYIKLK